MGLGAGTSGFKNTNGPATGVGWRITGIGAQAGGGVTAEETTASEFVASVE